MGEISKVKRKGETQVERKKDKKKKSKNGEVKMTVREKKMKMPER